MKTWGYDPAYRHPPPTDGRPAAEMGHIATAVNTMADSIRGLDALSSQISGIVGTIREVAASPRWRRNWNSWRGASVRRKRI